MIKPWLIVTLSFLTVYLNIALLRLSPINYLDLCLLLVLSVYIFTNLRTALAAALLSGFLMDLHGYYFGLHLALYLATIGLIFLISRFALAGKTFRSNWMLFLSGSWFFYVLQVLFNTLVYQYQRMPLSLSYILASGLIAAAIGFLMAILSRFSKVLRSELQHDKKSF